MADGIGRADDLTRRQRKSLSPPACDGGERRAEECGEELAAGKHYSHIMRDFIEAHTVQITLGVLAIVGFLVIFGIVSVVRASRRRRANLREWAFRNGFDYTEGPLPAYDLAPLPSLEVKGQVSQADANNITRGSRLTLFDLTRTIRTRYGVANRNTRLSTKTTSCAVFKLPEPLPRFDFFAVGVADPDSFQGKLIAGVVGLAQAVGLSEDRGELIPIEGRPGFLLRGYEPERIKPLFASDRVHFFDDKSGWSIEVDGTCLMVTCDPAMYEHGWERSTVVDEKNYDDFVRISQQVYDHFLHSSS